MTGTQSGLRERKKLAVRRALEAAALRLFHERGFDAVTVDEIVATVDVSRRTFFRYFGSKEEVVVAPLVEAEAVLVQALRARPDGEPVLDGLRCALAEVAQFMEGHRPELDARFAIINATPSVLARAVQQQDNLRRALTSFAAERLDADPTTDLRPHVAVAWSLGALTAAREVWHHGAPDCSLPGLLSRAYRLMPGGQTEPPGR